MGNTLKCNWQDGLGTSPTGEQCGECSPEFAKCCPALNKEKQIEEMDCKKCLHYEACQKDFRISKALSIYEDDYNEEQYFADTIDCDYYMDNLIYRKASDVAEKIFAEIEERLRRLADESKMLRDKEINLGEKTQLNGEWIGVRLALRDIAELKKKYTESEKDNG